ncbi:MAG: hypothetical protein WAL94_05715 [Bacteroidales bacterium]
MKTKFLYLFIIPLGFMISSCQKSAPLEDSTIEAADDAVLAEAVFDDAFASLEIATVIAEDMKKSGSVVDSCPLVTVTFPEQNFWPVNVVIDYGTGECDANATLSRGDEIKEITLRYRHPKYPLGK